MITALIFIILLNIVIIGLFVVCSITKEQKRVASNLEKVAARRVWTP